MRGKGIQRLPAGIFFLSAVLTLLLAFTTHAATNDLSTLLQKGLFEEEANRNLDAAISNYQSLANDFDKDRQLAATAVFRLGECYRKLGRTNEAVVQYQRIVRDFSDQQTLATLSQQNLTGLGLSGQPATQKQSSAISEQVRELELVKKLQTMPFSEVLQAGPTLLTDATLINLIYQYNQTELDLIRLRTDHGEGHPEVIKEKTIESALQNKIKERLEGLARALSLELGATADSQGKSTFTGESALSDESAITDEEAKEIRRIQQMIRNSPDLINVGSLGVNGNWTPLYQAAINGWLRVATYLLDHGADINAHSGDQGTALHGAADSGNKAMVELLLNHGADVNAKRAFRKTALHVTAEKGFLAVAETLLNHNADANASDVIQQPPLHVATEHGNVEMIKLLLAHGADLNAKDNNNATPLIEALRHYQTNAADTLLAAKPDVNVIYSNGQTALGIAVQNGFVDIAKALLAAKADPNGGTANLPLAAAIEFERSTNLCDILLHAGADPNKVGPISLLNRIVVWTGSAQAEYGQGSIIKASPIQLAIQNEQTDVVKLLLDYKGDANALAFGTDQHETLLMHAVTTSNLQVAASLIDHGAEVNASNDRGQTALFKALYHHQELLKLLIEHGADVNVADKDGNTPLRFAKGWNETDVVALLREHGALDDLPDFNAIRVTRQGMASPITLFRRASNDWNQITLFNVLGVQYHLVSASAVAGRNRSGSGNYGYDQQENSLPFPELSRVIVHRLSEGGEVLKELKIDVAKSLDSGDCTGDVPLQFGDVVEIPEADHVMNASWKGLATNELFALKNCLTRHIEVIVKGNTSNLTIAPQIELKQGIGIYDEDNKLISSVAVRLYQDQPLMLWPVLSDSKLLLASSDLSHIKVKRRDAAGKTREWTVDCTNPNSRPNFWLRDGDVIEVPDKAE